MAALPRLSVVTFTNGPTPLVAAALRHVRDVAHEIVVAVDARVPVDELGPLQDVADRLVRAEFVYPLEANLAWLHRQASGDWILRLDGDDLVSEALLRRLSTPGWDRDITHAYLQYRWLWGAEDRALDQAPWWPDPVLRLVRNLPGLVQFPTGAHQPAVVAGPARFWDEPLYHLDLLLRDEHTRAAKAAGYEHERPGHRTDRGWSVSTTYYVPETLRPAPRTAPIPPVDAAVVAAVLAAGRSHAPLPPPTDPAALAAVVTAADRSTPPPAPGDSRIRLLAGDHLTLVSGRGAVLTAHVTNLSGRAWSPDDLPGEVLGARFLDGTGSPVGGELRAPLPGPVPPDEETLVRLPVPPHVPAEAHRIEVGLVQDGVAWHDALATVRLRHERGRRVLVSTGVSGFPHLGDDLITTEVLAALARHLPDVVPVLLAHPIDGLAERFGCEVVPGPAAIPTTGARIDTGRRARDLVAQARLMAKGTLPDDAVVAETLAPFADACALVLAPGGGLASRYSDEALTVCAVQGLIARAFGLPVLLEGPSIGPIDTRKDQAALAQLLNDATRITVRDQPSADAARRIGRAIQPTVVADPATAALDGAAGGRAATRRWLDAHNIPEGRAYAVLSARDGGTDARHLDTFRRAAEALPEHTALVFLPHCTDGPVDDRRLVEGDDWARHHLVTFDRSLGDLAAVALIADATVTIGSRLHLSIVAAAAGVPAVALVGDDYDRLRVRGLKRWDGVRVCELDAPDAAAAAVADLLAAPRPESLPRWDGSGFAEALGALLPPPPHLA